MNAHDLKYYVFSPFDAMDFRIVKRLPYGIIILKKEWITGIN